MATPDSSGDAWATRTYEIDPDIFDGAVYTLLPPAIKAASQSPTLGHEKRHDDVHRWFAALEFCLARKNGYIEPTAVQWEAPAAPPLEASVEADSRAQGMARRYYPPIHSVLGALNDDASTQCDILNCLNTVSEVLPGYTRGVIRAFSEKMGINHSKIGYWNC